MSIVKSFSVGNGDMFYIRHGSSNFTIIDCCLPSDRATSIIKEIQDESHSKEIVRFISTHPDQDHISGLDQLDSQLPIINFYCVKNSATKSEETADFKKYRELRDSEYAFYIYKGVNRKFMNMSNDEIKSSGINILWPDVENQKFQSELTNAKYAHSPNNISPIIQYHYSGGNFIWMGDLETDFLTSISDQLNLPKTKILFAPHHGRDSGRVPKTLLQQMNPEIIVIGEAPSEHLNYYKDYNTITQNSAGDITFDCNKEFIHIYVSKKSYSVSFLSNIQPPNNHRGYYLGSL